MIINVILKSDRAILPSFLRGIGQIAKQAAAVNGQDERATPAVDSRRLFCFTADKAVKLQSA